MVALAAAFWLSGQARNAIGLILFILLKSVRIVRYFVDQSSATACGPSCPRLEEVAAFFVVSAFFLARMPVA
jgi:hypothetical protein